MNASRSAVRLRPATLADCAHLGVLNRQLIDAERHRNSMDIPALDARMRGWLLNDYRAIVAERGKQFVGYVLARRDAVELIIWRSIGFVDYAVALERAANASAAHVPPSSAP